MRHRVIAQRSCNTAAVVDVASHIRGRSAGVPFGAHDPLTATMSSLMISYVMPPSSLESISHVDESENFWPGSDC
jgi:hypothetical protein